MKTEWSGSEESRVTGSINLNNFIVFVLNDFTNMILLQFNFNLCNTMALWTVTPDVLKGAQGRGARVDPANRVGSF